MISDRTFHYRASFLNYAAIVAVGVAALCVFWHRSAANAVVGLVLMVAVVMMVEKVLHTAYTFTADGRLVVSRGRFSRPIYIKVSDIVKAERMRAGVLGVRYVLLTYGAGHTVSLQPVNEEAFIGEISRRQKEWER